MAVAVHQADCVAWLTEHSARITACEVEPFDSCVTDPPYHLTSIVRRFGGEGAAAAKDRDGLYQRASRGFMGKTWDGGDIAQRVETWRAIYDCLKPGAHLVAFSGTRTVHRMAVAIEDAGFEIRDTLMWLYGTGFPKSHDVSKGIDKAGGVKRERRERAAFGGTTFGTAISDDPITVEAAEWQGWGTALKPACEPIVLARKPISASNVAANVLQHGTGAINVAACRVGDNVRSAAFTSLGPCRGNQFGAAGTAEARRGTQGAAKDYVGRWPANVVTDGSAEVEALFPADAGGNDERIGMPPGRRAGGFVETGSDSGDSTPNGSLYGDRGSAARFFYSAKAGPLDRLGSAHATVKPVDLMRWLVRLVTPPGGCILEPFAGSGTTGIAALAEGFDCTMIELEADHVADIERKLAILRGEGAAMIVEHNRRRAADAKPLGGLFEGLA